MIVIVTGVSGSGKTTIGRRLADDLGWQFYDGDDFHSAANVEKMRSGVALTDAGREEWLGRLRHTIDELIANDKSAVIACSALKEAYRQRLRGNSNVVQFVHLKGDYDFIMKRMATRQGHYFGTELLASQFEALEEPREAMTVDARLSVGEAVATIRKALAI